MKIDRKAERVVDETLDTHLCVVRFELSEQFVKGAISTLPLIRFEVRC